MPLDSTLPLIDETDPFVSSNVLPSGNSLPEGIEPTDLTASKGRKGEGMTIDEMVADLAMHGDPERGGGKKKRQKPDDHNDRVKKQMEKFGWTLTKSEVHKYGEGGAVWKVDLWGFCDYQALKEGTIGVTGVQACAKGQIEDHLRTYRELPELRLWLSCGNRLLIVGAHQPKGKGTTWLFDIVNVTPELLDEYVARKRT